MQGGLHSDNSIPTTFEGKVEHTCSKPDHNCIHPVDHVTGCWIGVTCCMYMCARLGLCSCDIRSAFDSSLIPWQRGARFERQWSTQVEQLRAQCKGSASQSVDSNQTCVKRQVCAGGFPQEKQQHSNRPIRWLNRESGPVCAGGRGCCACRGW